MEHKIYFISDVEMGRGDIMDDFTDDTLLADFIEKITPKKKDQKATLVLLGDIFDFIKMSHRGNYPRYITEEISLWKLDEVISNHQIVFNALKQFLQNPNCEVHFIIGNHDPDIAWPKVQKRIREALRNHDQVKFSYKYHNKDIHAEHGHLQDAFFSINTKKPIIKFKNNRILNLPWGAYACFTHLVQIKKKFPKEESLYPNPLALEMHEGFNDLSKKTSLDLVIKSLVINPLLHLFDPTYRAPYFKLIGHAMRFGVNAVDDEKFVSHRVKKVIGKNPNKKVYILGHAHVLTEMEHGGKQVFLTDTWRDEFDLTNNEQKKPKTYVEISYKNDKLIAAALKKFKV